MITQVGQNSMTTVLPLPHNLIEQYFWQNIYLIIHMRGMQYP